LLSCETRLQTGNPDPPLVFPDLLQRNFDVPFPDQARKLLSPLNQQDAFRTRQIVKSERFQFTIRIDSVEIDVIKVRSLAAVFVDQGKRGARDIVGGGRSEAFGDSLDECRLTRAKITAQQYERRCRQFRGKLSPESDRLFGRVGVRRVGGHWSRS
jgi:hypothetical protein